MWRIVCSKSSTIAAQGGGVGFGIRREVFFLNLEDGYFGCQVNQSTEVLQLYELSRLCDGTPDCYLGSDELRKELKCTNDCVSSDGTRCQNGACLDSLCHCNDGFGGCSCEVPDENECKYRPCDVFAHCTNSLGSFHCSCFPGYTGDGFHCQDINECDNPALASRCVANAECCNLPAHFLCKCRPGYEGDGEVQCTDINECAHPNACGVNALCQNYPGNYTCSCQPGYTGNPFEGCIDIDECQYASTHPVCGPGARCTNFPGGYHCECPPGYHGDAFTTGCVDADECVNRPCGKDALCSNVDGSYTCTCPPGFIGDPFKLCSDINECSSSPCPDSALCTNTPGSYSCSCPAGYRGDPSTACYDVNECEAPNMCGRGAKCFNTPGSHLCVCPVGTTGSPAQACENINECQSNPCGVNATCIDTQGSYSCVCKEHYTGDPYQACSDIDECKALDKPCGLRAICENTVPGFNCLCPKGYSGKPDAKVACEQVDVTSECSSNFECVNNAECIDGLCYCRPGFDARGSVCVDVDECQLGDPCGPQAQCTNTPGSFRCDCVEGYVGAPPRIKCKAPCEDVKCAAHAYCKANGLEAFCMCEEGWTYDPEDISAGCIDIDECSPSHGPHGGCGQGAICTNTLGSYSCACPLGYTGNAFKQCININECSQGHICGTNALCVDTPGSYSCQCPADTTGDPTVGCVSTIGCTQDSDCPGNAVCDLKARTCHCPEPNTGRDCRRK
ncbi:hypothetical protein M8J75_009317 [Diaphorina citri]|nr:hypothetical protein M8J75_009317 [Diaphorina citri]